MLALAKFHPLARMGEISDVFDAGALVSRTPRSNGENIRVMEVSMPVGKVPTVEYRVRAWRTRPCVLPLFVQLFVTETVMRGWCTGVQSADWHACRGGGHLRAQIIPGIGESP